MSIQVESYRDLVQRVKQDPELMSKLQEEPVGTLEDVVVTGPVYPGDVWLYRFAVAVLGTVALIALVGALFISNGTTPDFVVAVGSAAIGALTGLFAPSPTLQNGNR